MSSPLGPLVKPAKPGPIDPARTWTHVRGEIWRNGKGQIATSEHGAKHHPGYSPPPVPFNMHPYP